MSDHKKQYIMHHVMDLQDNLKVAEDFFFYHTGTHQSNVGKVVAADLREYNDFRRRWRALYILDPDPVTESDPFGFSPVLRFRIRCFLPPGSGMNFLLDY
jgi:hypothetical protein